MNFVKVSKEFTDVFISDLRITNLDIQRDKATVEEEYKSSAFIFKMDIY